jgi:hypothetical protein
MARRIALLLLILSRDATYTQPAPQQSRLVNMSCNPGKITTRRRSGGPNSRFGALSRVTAVALQLLN